MRTIIADVAVTFEATAKEAYEYLADPRNRPEWQSSLRRVEDVISAAESPGGPGTSWVDVTAVPGVRPRMEVVAGEAGHRWVEIGGWRFVDAELVLTFSPRSDGAVEVRSRAWVTVPTFVAPTLVPLKLLAPQALRSDLRRAAAVVKARRSVRGIGDVDRG